MSYDRSKIKPGTRIRSWDFEPMEGRPDRYVEGIVFAVKDGLVHVAVIHDADGCGRTEISTPLELPITDYEKRLEILPGDALLTKESKARVKPGARLVSYKEGLDFASMFLGEDAPD